MDLLDWIVTNQDSVGVTAILMIIVAGMVLVLRVVYAEKNDCQSARLADREAIGEMRGDIHALNVRLDMEEKSKENNIRQLERLHSSVLELVAGVKKGS